MNYKGIIDMSRNRVRTGGSIECQCPKCKYSITHTRGVPCNQSKCPRCATRMVGKFCK